MTTEQAIEARVLAESEPIAVSERSPRDLLLGTGRGRFGVVVLGLFIFIAIFGTVLAPDDPYASSTDVLAAPSIKETNSERRRAYWCSAEPGNGALSNASRRSHRSCGPSLRRWAII